jgi:hypothetical protein
MGKAQPNHAPRPAPQRAILGGTKDSSSIPAESAAENQEEIDAFCDFLFLICLSPSFQFSYFFFTRCGVATSIR